MTKTIFVYCQTDQIVAPLSPSSKHDGDSGDIDPWRAVAEHSIHHPSIAIISVIRNEGRFLDEWIAFHWLQGVRKFVLFDDESEDGTSKILDKYIKQNIVDYRTVNRSAPHLARKKGHKGLKMDYINACLEEMWVARDEYGLDWVMFSDVDEFVYAKDSHMSLAQVLEAHYTGQICVNIFRKDFGSSGHISRPGSGLVIENYIQSASHYRASTPRKLIINLRHYDEGGKGIRVQDPHQLANPKQVQCINNSTEQMQMNRYLHSLEDYDVKLKSFKGSSNQDYKLHPLKHFWDRNRNEVLDDSAPKRYACKVRALLLYLMKHGLATSVGQKSATSSG